MAEPLVKLVREISATQSARRQSPSYRSTPILTQQTAMAPIAHSPRTPPLAPSPSALRLLLPSILLLALSACVLASEEPQPLRTLVRPQHAGGLAHSRRTQGRALAARLGAQAAASPSVPGAALPSAGPESRAGGEGGGDGGEGTEMGPPLLSPEKFVDPLPRPTVVSGSQGPITLGMYATTQVSTTLLYCTVQ